MSANLKTVSDDASAFEIVRRHWQSLSKTELSSIKNKIDRDSSSDTNALKLAIDEIASTK